MACRVTQTERVELAVFADIDEVKGTCARSLERINDLLIPQGVHLCRMDFRFQALSPSGAKLKKMREDESPLDDRTKDFFLKTYTLPPAAMQGLCLTAKQDMAVLDSEPVNPRLGPFARNHDGGSMQTQGSLADGSPLGAFPKFICNVTKESLPQIGQPFRKLTTIASPDGKIIPNCFHSLFHGSGVWYFHLPAGLCRIDVQCDWSTGWRVVHCGDTPFAYQMRPGMKLVQQITGPETWQASVFDETDLFTDAEALEDV